MEGKSDETLGDGARVERFCVVCDAPLASYNTGDQCFRHGAEEADDTDELRTLVERAAAGGALKETTHERKRLSSRILLATAQASEPAQPLPPPTSLALPGDAERVLSAVKARFGHSCEELFGPKRTQPLANIRHVAIYLLRQDFGWSLPKIAKLFRRDHQVVYYAHRKIRDALDQDENLRSIIEEIRERYRKEGAPHAVEESGEKPSDRSPPLTATKTVVPRETPVSSRANERKSRPRTKRRMKPLSHRKKKREAPTKEGPMTEKTIADVIRGAAHRWIDSLSIERLATLLPAATLRNSFGTTAKDQTGTDGPKARRRRRRRKQTKKDAKSQSGKRAASKRILSKEEGEMIRRRIGNLAAGSAEFKKLRNELIRKLGITMHQFVGALGGAGKHRS